MGLTTTKEWRWDAPGAHTLTGAVGSARILLRDFLLECGWSVIWEDAGAQKVVLRNSQAHGGSGCYVRILDDGSFTGGSRVARIDVYEAMSDIDTGTATAGGGYFWKDRDGSGGPNAYTLHGDERTAYGTQYVKGSTPDHGTGTAAGMCRSAWGLGDYAPYLPGDIGVFSALHVNPSPSTSANGTSMCSLVFRRANASTAPSSSLMSLSRSQSLAPSPTLAAVVDIGTPQNGVGIGSGSNQVQGGDNLIFLPGLVVADGYIRGRLRGLYVPCNDLITGGALDVGDIANVNAPWLGGYLALATLGGSAADSNSAPAAGRLFVESVKSWDDV